MYVREMVSQTDQRDAESPQMGVVVCSKVPKAAFMRIYGWKEDVRQNWRLLKLLRKQLVQECRNRRFKMHAFARHRVGEFQYPGMKRKTVERIGRCSIFFIPGYAVPHVLKMNPYLIFSAGL